MTDKTYTPDQVADAFTTIRDNLDLIEVAYAEAIGPKPVEYIIWDATAPGFLTDQGLTRLKTPSESCFYEGSGRVPDKDWLLANAVPEFAEYDPLSIDIECYGAKENPDDPAPYTETEIGYLCTVVDAFHEGNPGQRIGVYMTPPERYGGCTAYPPDHPKTEERWNNWTGRNEIMKPLADKVEILFPSLYALYPDMDQWVRFAQQNVEQARMLAGGKPVIGYLWITWHNNSGLTGYIGYDEWTIMLETLYPICDGIAIWAKSTDDFDPNAGYWKATEDFMKKYHLMGR